MDKELKEALEDVKPIVDKLFSLVMDRVGENEKAFTKGLVDSFELAGLQYSISFKVQVIKKTIDELDENLKEALR